MPGREFHYEKKIELTSNPEALWPLVSDTSRFNRDAGLPAVRILKKEKDERLMEMTVMGMKILWREIPFDWVAPNRFGVSRVYLAGPLRHMRVVAVLAEKPGGGCTLNYQLWAQASNLLGYLTIPFSFGVDFMNRAERVFKLYDRVTARAAASEEASKPAVTGPVKARVEILRGKLLERIADVSLVDRFLKFLGEGDSLSLQRIRPYVLAEAWKSSRRQTLEMFLHATRLGLVQFQWEVLCPLCRGAENKIPSLAELKSEAHCLSCNIDYTANFEQLVELTFKPTPSIRSLPEETLFCAGSPQITPHIMAQLSLAPGKTEELVLRDLQPGRYRARAMNLPGGQLFSVSKEGSGSFEINFQGRWPDEEVPVKDNAKFVIHNQTENSQRFIFERMAWSDQAVTAREVILMPLFRDLFAREALRPGEKISVGSVAIAFTDLRGSTKMYREIGDATAFGAVMDHFEIVFKAVRDFDGVLIKTIGDAVMAVFPNPGPALQAMARAQRELSRPATGRTPLYLKVGIHFGPAIAVTENDQLDYFGTTVNIAARLAGFSSGEDTVVSGSVYEDPETTAALADLKLTAQPFQSLLKGFENESFALFRVR